MEQIKLTIYAARPIESLVQALITVCDSVHVTDMVTYWDAGDGGLTQETAKVESFVDTVTLMMALGTLQEWLQTGEQTSVLVEIRKAITRFFERY